MAIRLERATWLGLLLLGAGLGYELLRPWLRVAGLVFTNLELLLLGTLAAWGLALAAGRRWPRVPAPPVVPLAAGAWLGVTLLAAVAAPSHGREALKFTARFGAGLLAGWAAYDLASTPGRRAALGKSLALGAISVALVGLGEAANLGPVAAWLGAFKAGPTRVGAALRVSASLSYANTAAMLLELALPLALAWLATMPARPRVGRWLLALGLAAMCLTLVLTYSRAGLATGLLTVAGLAVIGSRQGHPGLARAGAATTGLLLASTALAAAAGPVLGQRLSTATEQEWYQADYETPAALSLQPGESIAVAVTVTNTSRVTWPASGQGAVSLSYHLLGPDGTRLAWEGRRTGLPSDLQPGQAAAVQAQITAPSMPDQYVLEWDLVQEDVTWFSAKGAGTARTGLEVAGAVENNSGPVEGDALQPQAEVAAPPQPDRLTLWRLVMQMAGTYPLLGVGPDNFRLVYGAWAGWTSWDQRIHTNNLYLEWLAGTGWLGLLAFLAFSASLLGAVAAPLVRRAPERTGSARTWHLALAASLLAWYLHGLMDVFFEFTPTYLAFWLVAALALRAAGAEQGAEEEKRSSRAYRL